ncbi:unnamed protein product [Notodromas monacha]|uniref:Cytochrome b5 heme-binding domain-containing protein n=1 Tax=Notodromas monacha TaxID=399045 RepID=A0A7R9GAB9_9CRUS|nr:unnamed protein product [Notodromas monacha]CAG0915189.1 unnamed protein product [Notodromas monacha]
MGAIKNYVLIGAILFGIVAIIHEWNPAALSYWGLSPKKTLETDWAKLMADQGLAVEDDLQPERIFKSEQLSNPTDGKIFLAILGRVYDVTDGKDHYGPGGGYAFFAGEVAS